MSTPSQNKKLSGKEELILCKLSLDQMQSVMALQDKVVEGIVHKEMFVSSPQEELEEIIKDIGCMMGYQTQEGKLVAMGVYAGYGYHAHNYGYDLGFEGEELLTVGQIEATIVDPDYRGIGLQRKLCEALEEVARKDNKTYITATVSPINPYSLNNFLTLGYENKLEKLKYGGVKRYILCKKL